MSIAPKVTMEAYFESMRRALLRKEYGVLDVIRHELDLAPETKMEYFLLGATFITITIPGFYDETHNVMLYKDTIHILGEPII